ncbi:MAG: (d)CMP kinase [Armatimonadetes bacterium]|nr:(d)CMP kinase [Armatimonadota bacterium]
MSKKIYITIDGPAGAGKSTVARMLARRLGFQYIDTGAMYRAVALKALRTGVDLNDEAALAELAASAEIRLADGPGGSIRVFLDGEDVTRAIRSLEVTKNVSLVARAAGVRSELVRRQRKMAGAGENTGNGTGTGTGDETGPPGVVMEGRDAGTVILPEAQFKFFLTASAEERARRRQKDLQDEGREVPLARLKREIEERDRLDSSREVAPLRPAQDAQVIDCSRLSAAQVVEIIASRVGGKTG